jgi:hypothetical protein
VATKTSTVHFVMSDLRSTILAVPA